MYRKLSIIAVVLCLSLMPGMVGCSRKSVRHLASDVALVTPGITTKEEVLTYLGPPNAEYEVAEGGVLWVYYDEKKDLLHNTPYIGEKVGEQTFEVVKVTINGDIVETVGYRAMSEGEFRETGLTE